MKIDTEIIDRVLDNTASPGEARQVIDWFGTDEGQTYLSQRITAESTLMGEKEIDDWTDGNIPTAQMRERFLTQIKQIRRRWSFRRVAAVIIPLILLSGLTFFADKAGVFSETHYAEVIVPCGERKQVILQDGTTVELNSASTLRYPMQFGMFSRKVELYGEGYFKVAKDKGRPFSVQTNHLQVQVTGTQFNMKAYPEDTHIFVTLDEGKVVLKTEAKRDYPLVPGEIAIYNWRSGECAVTRPDDLEGVKAWRINSLNFYMVPLMEIIKVMERQYETSFIVNDSTLLESKYTFSTSKVNVIDVLHDLETVSHIEFLMIGENTFEIRRKD